MTVNLQPTDATLGALVTGVRIGHLNDEDWRAVEDAFHKYGVLIFPDQHPTRDEQFAFATRFGKPEHLAKALRSRWCISATAPQTARF